VGGGLIPPSNICTRLPTNDVSKPHFTPCRSAINTIGTMLARVTVPPWGNLINGIICNTADIATITAHSAIMRVFLV